MYSLLRVWVRINKEGHKLAMVFATEKKTKLKGKMSNYPKRNEYQ